jgi:DNA-directed RNA polymerase specialized sigma24 family protein
MKSYQELNNQLNHLVSSIKECNFIPNHIKKDIVSDSFVKIVEKMNDGTLIDDFNTIKGYTFFILKNFCLAYHKQNTKHRNVELKKDLPNEEEENIDQYLSELKKIISQRVSNRKYSNIQREFLKLIYENKKKPEILEKLNLTLRQYKYIRQGLVLKMQGDLRRQVKYLIKNIDQPEFNIFCYTASDVRYFFKDLSKLEIMYILHEGEISPNGYYVQRLFEKKKKVT